MYDWEAHKDWNADIYERMEKALIEGHPHPTDWLVQYTRHNMELMSRQQKKIVAELSFFHRPANVLELTKRCRIIHQLSTPLERLRQEGFVRKLRDPKRKDGVLWVVHPMLQIGLDFNYRAPLDSIMESFRVVLPIVLSEERLRVFEIENNQRKSKIDFVEF